MKDSYLKEVIKNLNLDIAEKTQVNDNATDSVSDTYSASKIEERISTEVNNHVKTFVPPAVLTIVAGTGGGIPTVAQAQVPFDGNVLTVQELAATPGYDVRFTFTGVTSLKGLGLRFYYDGGVAGHTVTFDIYNQVTSAWDSYILVSAASTYSYRYIEFPNGSNYIRSNGEVYTRFYHTSMGDAAHYIYIDFVGVAY